MICVIVVCALVAGTGRCDPQKVPEIIDMPEITKASDCQHFSAWMRAGGPVPANFKLMRVEMLDAPKMQGGKK